MTACLFQVGRAKGVGRQQISCLNLLTVKIIGYITSCLFQIGKGKGVGWQQISCLKFHAEMVTVNTFRFYCLILTEKKIWKSHMVFLQYKTPA